MRKLNIKGTYQEYELEDSKYIIKKLIENEIEATMHEVIYLWSMFSDYEYCAGWMGNCREEHMVTHFLEFLEEHKYLTIEEEVE